MANKRIELEHYRTYVNLVEEEPNRKTSRRGFTVALLVAVLLAVLFLVLGFFTNDRAKNPSNILEKPSAPAKSEGAAPPGSPPPSEKPEGKLHRGDLYACDAPGPIGTATGSLLAMLTTTGKPVSGPELSAGEKTPASEKVGKKDEKARGKSAKKKKKSLPQQTRGVGNISNLARSLNERGFQLYVLALTITFGCFCAAAIARVRRERKKS